MVLYTRVSPIPIEAYYEVPLTTALDVKLDNIFVFADIQLGDCGGVVPTDSKLAKEGHTIGAAYARSPEVNLNIPWSTPTDIWSFGNMIGSRFIQSSIHLFLLLKSR
jgi:hypothetical protein